MTRLGVSVPWSSVWTVLDSLEFVALGLSIISLGGSALVHISTVSILVYLP